MPSIPFTRTFTTVTRSIRPTIQKPSAFTRIQPAARRFRSSESFFSQTPPDWISQAKKVGNVSLLYFPVVACVMFWPYAVAPAFNVAYGVKKIKPSEDS